MSVSRIEWKYAHIFMIFVNYLVRYSWSKSTGFPFWSLLFMLFDWRKNCCYLLWSLLRMWPTHGSIDNYCHVNFMLVFLAWLLKFLHLWMLRAAVIKDGSFDIHSKNKHYWPRKYLCNSDAASNYLNKLNTWCRICLLAGAFFHITFSRSYCHGSIFSLWCIYFYSITFLMTYRRDYLFVVVTCLCMCRILL